MRNPAYESSIWRDVGEVLLSGRLEDGSRIVDAPDLHELSGPTRAEVEYPPQWSFPELPRAFCRRTGRS